MSSSLFPFLRSLLISPLKADVQTATIQQTIEDRDRGGFTTPDRQQDHLSWNDTGLRGPQGALIVLDALAANPFAHKLTLSHNQLGDLGVRQLCNRIRFLKNRRTVLVHELNLATNLLTNEALNDLSSSWEGLMELYLSNNQINLQSNPSPILNLGNLTLLSLTSNPIDCESISTVFRNQNFAPLELTTLHLSACNLDLSVAISLALWLEDKVRSGKLEWLAVNGNKWGTPGCERITWALARKGGNSNLLRLEMLACCDSSSSSIISSRFDQLNATDIEVDTQNHQDQIKLMGFRTYQDFEHCCEAIEIHESWNQLLDKCELRNQALRLATRRAALGLVSSARLILLSSPAGIINKNKQEISKKDIFPWDRLPGEIKLKIWRWVSILSAFPKLKYTNQSLSNNQPLRDQITPHHYQEEGRLLYEIPDPLNAIQLKNLIEYAQDRNTLQTEIFQRDEFLFNQESNLKVFNDNSLQKNSFHRQSIQNHRLGSGIDRLGRSFILKTCNCQRFLGSI